MHIHNKKLESKSKNFTAGINTNSLENGTLSVNPTETEFNEALNSFKPFAEAILSGENKSQKLRLFGMLKNFSNPLINILPTEILEKIFKLLSYKTVCQAQLICRRWKEIIVRGNLLKKSSGMTSTN